jgi:hypothetical protein
VPLHKVIALAWKELCIIVASVIFSIVPDCEEIVLFPPHNDNKVHAVRRNDEHA